MSTIILFQVLLQILNKHNIVAFVKEFNNPS